jgi:outer membrane protein OmpA-like peptidoglycan-associated protein
VILYNSITQNNSKYLIVIEGHRDSSERIGISLTRAFNLRDYLVNEKKIDASRIRVRNFGNTCPNFWGETFRNSRIEIGVLPVERERELEYSKTVYPCQKGSNPRVIEGESPA